MHRGCPVGEEDGHFFGCLDRLFFMSCKFPLKSSTAHSTTDC